MRQGGSRDQPPGKRSWGKDSASVPGLQLRCRLSCGDMWLTLNCHSEQPAMLTCAQQLCGLDSPVLEVMAL